MSFKLEQLVIELKQSVETLKQTVETQQLRIDHLSSVADLTFPIVSDIYKSHLIKGTSRLIFWSLSHRVGHYVSPETITLLDALVEVLISRGQGRGDAELKAIALNEAGLHTPAEIQILSDARSLRNVRFTPRHLYLRTPNNTIGSLDSNTLARLRNEVSPGFELFTI